MESMVGLEAKKVGTLPLDNFLNYWFFNVTENTKYEHKLNLPTS